MRIQELWREMRVVKDFTDMYLSRPALFPDQTPEQVKQSSAYARELLEKAGDVFTDHSDARTDCESCVKELLQFSRALALTHVTNKQLLENANYERDYTLSVAALKHIAATVRLHFLLLDLKALVEDQ